MGDFLVDLVQPTRLTSIVDIGANPIDSSPPYKPLLEKRLCRVIGFEPQPDGLASLNARKSDLETYLPYVIADGQSATLRVCNAPGMTSLFAPDPNALRHFPGFPEWGRVAKEIPVTTRRLDDIPEIETIDFIKMDVQGAELMVIQNGRERLKDVVVIQTEVSFIALYTNQPAFGAIDSELRRSGFVPHSLPAVNKRMIAPLVGSTLFVGINQIVEADIVYVRDFTHPDRMSPEQLKHLALIAHHCCASFDLAANCLYHLARRGAVHADAMKRYLALVQSGGASRVPS
jgi:FkbM family methyltransferase